MTRGKGNKEVKRGGQGEWERQNDRQTEHYSCENAQSLPHFHFSSSILAAHELKECTAGQPAAHLDSTPFPSVSSPHPTLRQTLVSTCPPQSNANMYPEHPLWRIFVHTEEGHRYSPPLNSCMYPLFILLKSYLMFCAEGHPTENRCF